MLKLTPAGVNTGPISNGVNLTPFWCYFNTFRCFSSPIGVISTPKSVEIHQNGVKITPLEIGPVLTPAGVNLTPEFLHGVRLIMLVDIFIGQYQNKIEILMIKGSKETLSVEELSLTAPFQETLTVVK